MQRSIPETKSIAGNVMNKTPIIGLIIAALLIYNNIHSRIDVKQMDSIRKDSNQQGEVLLLAPFDTISTDVLQQVGEDLGSELGLDYRIMPEQPLPAAAFHADRNQYLAPLFLNTMLEKYGEENARVLGIVDHDLYVPELNFVFGQADLVNKVAIISLTRLRPEWYGMESDEELFRRRILTEAVHELGHTYGLKHCKNRECVMFFSNSLADTDRKGYRFCGTCLNKLKKE